MVEPVRLPTQNRSLSYGSKFWRGQSGAPLLPPDKSSPRSGRKGDDRYLDRTYIAMWSAVTWWRWVMSGNLATWFGSR